MRVTFLLAFLIALGGCSPAEKQGVSISGKVKNATAGTLIEVLRFDEGGFVALDSMTVGEDGSFQTRLAIPEEGFYRLNIMDRLYVNLIFTGEEDQVNVEVDAGRTSRNTEVTGSYHTQLMMQMDSLVVKKKSDAQMLQQEALQARSQGDMKTLGEISAQFEYLTEKHDRNLKGLIRDAVPSLAGLYGMNYVVIEEELAFADSLAGIYQSVNPEHPFTKDIVSKVSSLRTLAVGAEAPEINLPSPNGEMIALSSLRGNYVLIDFWAAWCRPCRMENPNVVRLYNKYKDENFEIYGVSLDRKREAWLKAIEDDGLTWKHVSDLKYFNSVAAREYNITGIPATYLIGPDGRIVAKNLRGESLRAKLAEIFG